MASINACGYDQDLEDSLPLRAKIRTEVLQAANNPAAQASLAKMCRFYADHMQSDPSRQLSQYVSLGLHLGDEPAFELTCLEADLPPDAVYVLGIAPLVRQFYADAGLDRIWHAHRAEYDALVETYAAPLREMLLSTEVYLNLPLSSYRNRSFVVYLEPLAAPSQVNSRVYDDDYLMVVSPAPDGIRLDWIRHAYLHFLLDPWARTRFTSIERLQPLLATVKGAPMESGFKEDVALLLTECLVRAVEAHLLGGRKGPEEPRQALVAADEREGFVLTQYYYAALTKFAADPVNFDQAYGAWLLGIQLEPEIKHAHGIEFAKSASPEVVRGHSISDPLLRLAEHALMVGNLEGAEQFASQGLEKGEDPGHALFLLARIATLQKQVDKAQQYFERTLSIAKSPRIIAWSHIYLGRIADLREQREQALAHYQAALAAGDNNPITKRAAEKGIQQPYAAPAGHPADREEDKK